MPNLQGDEKMREQRRERFRAWMREVDSWLHEFTGKPSDLMPDDPRFVWWTWFDDGLSPESAAQAVVEIVTDAEGERYRLHRERAARSDDD
ncbi:hypothetical protein [Microbacterium sp.]|uniref:hypothetical protein n=1 Tax=Microbacterium sp. TaxID=51671 RepID=UPI003F9617FE